MRSRPIVSASQSLVLLAAVVLHGCGNDAPPAPGPQPSEPASETALTDRELPAWQAELLDLAFETASAFPVHPHIKNRMRAQEAVVTAALELDQPKRALGYLGAMAGWRAGAGYADLALHCVKKGLGNEVQPYLDRALKIAEEHLLDEDSQDWHRDRIRAAVARTHMLLGRSPDAQRFEAGLVDSEAVAVLEMRAAMMDAKEADAWIESVDAATVAGNLDQVRNVARMCGQLFNRFYGDAPRRERIEAKLAAVQERIPAQVRIETKMELASFALDHGDDAKARVLVQEARKALEGTGWIPKDRIPLQAKLAVLRYRTGELAEGKRDADAALAAFNDERDAIVDIYRAGALRVLAQAYQLMGDGAAALRVYGRAVEEGVVNPNSRPRADDLAATCCSMALHGAAPGDALLKRMRAIHAGLGEPW